MVRTGYKQTEVGEIPDDWDSKPLEKVTTSISSGTSNTQAENGDYPLYGSTGRIGHKTYFDYEGKKILVARVGANAGTVNKISGKYCVSDNTLIVNISNDVNLEFYYFQLVRKNLNNLVFGSGQPLLTGGQLKRLNLAAPKNRSEQKAIAKALSDVDELIVSLEKLIAKKRDIKTATMQQLLTGKKRLTGFGEGKSYKQTELGEIPEDWDIVSLGQHVEINSGESPSKFNFVDQGLPYFKVEQLNNDPKYVLTTPYYFFKGKTISAGSLIFPKRGASILLNKIRILKNDSFMDTNLMTLTTKDSLVNEYLYYCLDYTGLSNVADTTSIPQINNKHITPFLIPYPNPEEQRSIAGVLCDLDVALAVLGQRLNKTKSIKQGMMQELLTGRTRLI